MFCEKSEEDLVNLDAKSLGSLSVGEGISTLKDGDHFSQSENNCVLRASERAQAVGQCLGVKAQWNNSWWIAVIQQLIVSRASRDQSEECGCRGKWDLEVQVGGIVVSTLHTKLKNLEFFLRLQRSR